jgi:hypothetical protein
MSTTNLCHFILNGDEDGVESAIKQGAIVNQAMSPLYFAIVKVQTKQFRFTLSCIV